MIQPGQILSVKRKLSNARGPAKITYSDGKFGIVTAMDGWNEALTRLRSLNPAMEVYGL